MMMNRMTPRCPLCADVLERCDGELYCPSCTRFTVAELAAEADAEALELRAMEGRMADEELPTFDPDDDNPF
jgi:uncharacterized Zn finger protein (UPF0148 family)